MKTLRLTALAFALGGMFSPLRGQEKPLTAEENEFFEAKIRPALIEHCHKCHSGDKDAKIKGGLQVDSKAALLKGGSSGPGLVAGQPDRSLIIKAMRFTDPNLQMPPKEKLPDSVVADFENWVRMGAPDPRSGKAAAMLKTDEDLAKAKKHWAFQPIAKPEPPKPKAHLKGWIQNDIDLFVVAKLEEKGLFPSPIADKWTLIRRADSATRSRTEPTIRFRLRFCVPYRGERRRALSRSQSASRQVGTTFWSAQHSLTQRQTRRLLSTRRPSRRLAALQ